jgi:SAM-dependent methyltransferase
VLNWSLRYLPLVDLLDRCDATTVLDVGSGVHGLSTYRPGTVVQTDLRFDAGTTLPPGRGTAVYVAANAERLAFADESFDFVVSLDLIEHLPVAARPSALIELCRVARRGVIVGFPSGPAAQRTDRCLARTLAALRRKEPDWLTEHLDQARYPDAKTVTGALPTGWRVDCEVPLGNALLTFVVVLAEHLPVVHRLTALIDRIYRRRGPVAACDRGTTYRAMWLLRPAS